MSKLPAFQFYSGDWLKDPALRSCTRAARGLWIDMLSLMNESPHRGYLERGDGSPYSLPELISLVGGEEECRRCGSKPLGNRHQCPHFVPKIAELCTELEQASVLFRRRNGAIYSRRMVRDEELRQIRASGGSKSLEHPNVAQPKSEITPQKDILPPTLKDTLKDGTANPSFDDAEGYPEGGDGRPSPSSSSSLKTSLKTKALKTLSSTSSTLTPSATSSSVRPAGADPEQVKRHESQIITALFAFYCEQLHRDPARYTLTDERRKKALLRLHERMKVRGSLPAAIDEINTAIKNLAASDYHVSNGYTDWIEQIFRSAEEFEKRLNWVKPNGGTSHASNHETREQRNERIYQEAIARLDSEPPEDDEQPAPESDAGKPQ